MTCGSAKVSAWSERQATSTAASCAVLSLVARTEAAYCAVFVACTAWYLVQCIACLRSVRLGYECVANDGSFGVSYSTDCNLPLLCTGSLSL